MGIKLLFTFLTVNVNRCLFNLTLYNFDKMCLIALIYNKPAFVPNFVSSYCEMQIEGIQTSLPCFLLLAQFIVATQIPIWVGFATCVLKRWHKGTNVHHNRHALAQKVHHNIYKYTFVLVVFISSKKTSAHYGYLMHIPLLRINFQQGHSHKHCSKHSNTLIYKLLNHVVGYFH